MNSRQKFRYAGLTRFFKGNTHIHTTNSDGGWTPDEAVSRYRDAGYHFIAITDHNVVTRMEHRSTADFCLLDSVEIDQPSAGPAVKSKLGGATAPGRGSRAAEPVRVTDNRFQTRHIVCIGVGPDFPEKTTFRRMLAAARRDQAILCLAHPHWSGNTFSQVARGGFTGVELFNGVCYYLNHREGGVWMWDEMLGRGLDLFGFAADDNHGRPEGVKQFDLGWIMVAAKRLDRPSILAAIRAGQFYSSTGPQFRSLEFAGGKLIVRCSPVRNIWLNGPTWVVRRINCPAGHLTEEHTFDVADMLAKNRGLPFLRLEIEDELGRRAWTNKLFV